MHVAQFPPLPEDYRERMPQYLEATSLIEVGSDSLGRPLHLTPATSDAWHSMQHAASHCGLSLILVSAFRSYTQQEQILLHKLNQGVSWNDILTISAFPGFSEHHTGRALDLGSPEFLDLTESFEHTPEFAWLCDRAASFGFYMSYPRGNRYGIAYEPWHWTFQNSG